MCEGNEKGHLIKVIESETVEFDLKDWVDGRLLSLEQSSYIDTYIHIYVLCALVSVGVLVLIF